MSDLARSALDNDLTLRAAAGCVSSRAQHLESLRMAAFLGVGMCNTAKADLKRHLFTSILVEIEAKCVDAFVAKRVRRSHAGAGVNRHRHDYRPGRTTKQTEVTEVDSRIVASSWGIEMM
jgi:hypothetical protein